MPKDLNHQQILLRAIQASDIPLIVREFERFQWSKPASTFEMYCKEQTKQERLIWLAFYKEALKAGFRHIA